MSEKLNPRTITHIEVDRESRFKYLFLALGVAIRGFRYMRKVVGIDGTFLKGHFRAFFWLPRHKTVMASITHSVGE